MAVTTTRGKRRRITAVGAVLIGLLLVFGDWVNPAYGVDLPTWDDVQAAKQNEAETAKKITEIEEILSTTEAELELLRTATGQANSQWQEAEIAAEEAALRTQELEAKATQSREEADASAEQAGTLVAEMYRSGGLDLTAEVFLESDLSTTDALLDRLAMMEKATERNATVAERAEVATNTAESLGAQADAARNERDVLAAEAEKKAQAAAENLDRQRAKFLEQEAKQKELEAQLSALKDETTDTVKGYEERLRVEEEARRKLEEERKQQQEEQPSGDGGGGNDGGGGSGGGTPGNAGWYQPVPISWISTYFRVPPSHTGLDLPAGCGVPIVAPAAGTVSVAGWVDNFGGYMTYLDQDNGYQTRFAHQIGTPPVVSGQWVPAGSVIGYVGNTGMSFGCHVHYEVLQGGMFVDPVPFI